MHRSAVKKHNVRTTTAVMDFGHHNTSAMFKQLIKMGRHVKDSLHFIVPIKNVKGLGCCDSQRIPNTHASCEATQAQKILALGNAGDVVSFSS